MTNEQENTQPQAVTPKDVAPEQKAPIQKEPLKVSSTSGKGEKRAQDMNFDMMMLKETIINYIVPIVCVGASVLIGVLVLMPSYKSIPNLSAEYDKNTMLESTLRNKLNNMNRLLEFKSIVDENSDLVNKVLVSEELVPGLLTQIDKIARESGLEVTRLNYGLGSSTADGKSKATYKTVTINLGATGSFAQLKNFMNSVENAARIVLVDNFRYSATNNDEGDAVGVNFVLVSPYLFVESSAVTDDPVDLDIADEEFQALINKIKGMKYYDPYEIDTTIPLIETPEVEEGDEVLEGSGAEEVVVDGTLSTTPSTEEIIEDTIESESIFP